MRPGTGDLLGLLALIVGILAAVHTLLSGGAAGDAGMHLLGAAVTAGLLQSR